MLNRYGSQDQSSCRDLRLGVCDCKSSGTEREAAREELDVSDTILRGDLIPRLVAF